MNGKHIVQCGIYGPLMFINHMYFDCGGMSKANVVECQWKIVLIILSNKKTIHHYNCPHLEINTAFLWYYLAIYGTIVEWLVWLWANWASYRMFIDLDFIGCLFLGIHDPKIKQICFEALHQIITVWTVIHTI